MAKKGYIIPHTHWDREWRYPLWESRINLVKMIDELLDVLDSQPEYKSFLFDGQVVQIFDYLVLRPENEERLKAHIKNGRILVGPWYTLPDLYPVSGESIIRNLQKGIRESEKLGKSLKIGYESFGWGQPSQFPQMYAGFGIDTVIVAKHVDKSRAPHCEFVWEGKDGTALLATRLGTEARGNFFMHTYIESMSGREYKSDAFRYEPGKDQVFHEADSPAFEHDYFKLSHTASIHTENLRELALKSWHAMDDTLLDADRAMMDGSDSTTAQPDILALLSEINKQTVQDGIVFEMSSLVDYVDILKKKLDKAALRRVKGELRDGPAPSVSGNALMVRPHIKQLNRSVQNALMGCAEPMAVMAGMTGTVYPKRLTDAAADYMLLSHSHDSINGVTQDRTAEDVVYRLEQALEISNAVATESAKEIIRRIDTRPFKPSDILLAVFNPLPYARREVVTAYVDTPQEDAIWSFELEDSDGDAVETAHLGIQEKTAPVVSLYSRPEPFYADRHHIQFDTGMIPAAGYKVFRVAKPSRFVRKTEFWAETAKTRGQEIAKSPTCLENEYLCVEIAPDGTVRITDKETRQTYGPLNYFESTADVGDYWVHYPAYRNDTVTSIGGSARIHLEENTALQATAGVTLTMAVNESAARPANYVRGESGRTGALKALEIRVWYTLHKGEKKLDVKTEIDNTVKDHRMCVKFDMGIVADAVDAEGHFCVDHRPVLPLKDSEGRYYREMTTQPMQRFVDVSDGARGFGIVTDSIGEYDASKEKTISLTLFRAVKNIICTEFRSASHYASQQGGQLQRTLTYRYALAPHTGGWEQSGLLQEADRLNIPVKTYQFSAVKSTAELSCEHSFFSVEGAAVSAVKKAEDSEHIIMRVYNPYAHDVQAIIRFAQKIRSACTVDFNEANEQPLPCGGDALTLPLGPDKIATVKIEI